MRERAHHTRWPIVVVALALHAVITTRTWRDIAFRPENEIRGPKNLWRAASVLNTGGSLAYWLGGRIRPQSPVDEIPLDECWELLEHATVGRLATLQLHEEGHEDGLDIFPLNYLVRDGALYFRSGPGSKLMELTEHHTVVFEIDGHHGNTHWSVIVHGRADRLGADVDIENSGILELESFHPSEKWNFVRITPEQVTGRRFRHYTQRPEMP